MANLIISNVCSASCEFCFASSFLRKKEDTEQFMTMEMFASYLGLLNRSGIEEVRLLGGEPTLHPNFADFVRIGREQGKRITVFSNGLFPDSALEALLGCSADECAVIINMNARIKRTQEERKEYVLRQLGSRAIAGITVDSPVFSLDPLIQKIQRYGMKDIIRMGIALPVYGKRNQSLHPKQYPAVAKAIVCESYKSAAAGIRIEPDCGFVRCMFSDIEFRVLNRNGFSFGSYCSPILDCCTNGEILHCFALSDSFSVSLRDELATDAIREDLTCQSSAWRSCGIYPECEHCSFRQNEECCGGCLAAVMNRFTPAKTAELCV